MLLWLVSCLLALSCATVEEITPDNIDGLLIHSDIPVIAKFYSPWCSHCKSLAPKFEAAAKKSAVQTLLLSPLIGEDRSRTVKQPVRWVSIDCQQYSYICEEFDVKGYPVVQYFPPYWRKGMPVRKFRGPRTTANLKDFASRMARKPLIHIDSMDVSVFNALGTVDMYAGSLRFADTQDYTDFTTKWGRDNTTFILAYHKTSVEEGTRFDTAVFKAWMQAADNAHDELTLLAVEQSNLPNALRSFDHPQNYIIKLRTSGTTYTARHFAIDACHMPAAPKAAGEKCDLQASITKFLAAHRFADLTTISMDNFAALVNNKAGAYVAIGILPGDKAGEQSEGFLQLLNDAATRKVLSNVPVTSLLYAQLDSNVFDSFLTEYGIKKDKLPALFVLDMPSNKFWYNADLSHNVEAWAEFIQQIFSGDAPVSRQGVMALPQQLVNAIGWYPAVFCMVAGTAVLAWVVWKLVFAELLAPSSPRADSKQTQQEADKAPKQDIGKQRKSFRDTVPDLQTADNSDGELSDGDIDNFLEDHEVTGSNNQKATSNGNDDGSSSSSEEEVVEGLRQRKNRAAGRSFRRKADN